MQVVLATCAVVATAHLLGAAWLSETVLGVPAGVWVIGLAAAGCAPTFRQRLSNRLERLWEVVHPGVPVSPLPERGGADRAGFGWWPRAPLAGACVDAFTRVAAGLAWIAKLQLWPGEVHALGGARLRAEAWLSRVPWPTRPLRIGLHMPADEADALIGAPGTCRVEWFRLGAWDDPQTACRRHLLDAVLYHDGEGPVRIVTLERTGHGAGIVEWADLQGELTFGTLFPARVDPAAVVLEGATRTRVREGADLLRGLLEAAATLARAEGRLTPIDRVLGRHATDDSGCVAGVLRRSSLLPARDVFAALLAAAARRAETWPEAARLAAQAAGAFYAACPGLDAHERVHGLTLVAEAGSDAVNALRLGAASIGALDDERGLEWLVKADALLRLGAPPLAPLDHAAFLESELAHGTDDALSVGRAAAGICMVCAATPAERIHFVRDDMLEEMAYAGWLVGRDQDRGLLISVFLEIEHAHAGPARGKLTRQERTLESLRRRRIAA